MGERLAALLQYPGVPFGGRFRTNCNNPRREAHRATGRQPAAYALRLPRRPDRVRGPALRGRTLEELERAKARGAKIYAEVAGYSANSDGDDMVQPSGEGAARYMRQAMEGLDCPIDYINPHATATPVGDLKEIEAVREVFGDDIPAISATKSLTGHSLGAAGVQESIYSMLMMKEGFICESANITELDPAFADIPIVRKRQDNVELNCVMSNSFGFGGTNASVVYKKFVE